MKMILPSTTILSQMFSFNFLTWHKKLYLCKEIKHKYIFCFFSIFHFSNCLIFLIILVLLHGSWNHSQSIMAHSNINDLIWFKWSFTLKHYDLHLHSTFEVLRAHCHCPHIIHSQSFLVQILWWEHILVMEHIFFQWWKYFINHTWYSYVQLCLTWIPANFSLSIPMHAICFWHISTC